MRLGQFSLFLKEHTLQKRQYERNAMIHNRQTIVSPFYFKIVYMKFLFEMLLKTFPPSPSVIYFFVAHLTSCQSSRIYFSVLITTVCALNSISMFLLAQEQSENIILKNIYSLKPMKYLKAILSGMYLGGSLHTFFLYQSEIQDGHHCRIYFKHTNILEYAK